ncbi:sporulation protein YpjB [Cohnella hashimotonis]|uniref:Sporulation protein YpjB n=1 Tax=Cohnella hashimotonis TaxID=2826895 RepID=A0ABT6TF99_9BACL|nr:sporulation protein YpjB [Cohnella hashimotonis]MDI4645514.1 sporulation protein YpjB [Cohnella hashimotonis]
MSMNGVRIRIRIRMSRRALAAALLILWLEALLGGQAAAADGEKLLRDPVDRFRLAAESLYRSVSDGDPLVVLRNVTQAEEALLSVPSKSLPAPEATAALAAAMERMRRAVSALSPDAEEVYGASASLRLAADAVSPNGQGLWLDYRRLMREDTEALRTAITSAGDRPSPEAKERLTSLSGHYGLIRTAVVATGRGEQAERADAVIRYAERILSADAPDPSLAAELAPRIGAAIEGLYPPAAEAPTSGSLAAAPPAGFFSAIGAFILTVLTYSGWRKYRGERRNK